MTEEQIAMTPEERLSKGLCCECACDLSGLDVPHHSITHWPQYIRPDGLNAEAIRRQGLLADYVSSTPPVQRKSRTEPEKHESRPEAPKSTTTAPPPAKL